ncbi:MAG: DUF4374 domain-containing protein [Tannerella sp.]|jgi:hypothetical protein|nr:DUF4374 domain-containing protein [Tannerella sp.]
MKKVNFKVCMMLAAASCFVACDKNDDNKAEKAKLVLALDMSVNDAAVGYIVPVGEGQMNGGTASLVSAHEVYPSPYVVIYRDWAYNLPNAYQPPIIKRFTRQDDGSLLPSGELALSQNNMAGAANILFLSDTKAYATLMLENKIVIFNPTAMTKTGEIDLARTEYGVGGSATPNPAGMIYRDGKVFVGCFELAEAPMTQAGAYIIVINEATDTPEKFISDQRGSSASYFNNLMYEDEKGDIYVVCWASYGYIPEQKSGFLRIKKGQTDFDPDYFLNISDMNIAGIEGGHVTLTNFCYGESGIAYMSASNFAYASNPIDYVNDKVIQSFKVDLYNRTVTVLDLPRSNAYSYSIVKWGDLILFGLTTTSNGSGFFSYNPKTGETSRSPILNAPGTILAAGVFE